MNLFVHKCNIQKRNIHWNGTAREDMQPPLTAASKNKKNKSTLILAPNDRCKPKKSSHDENIPIQNLTQNSTIVA